MRNFKRLLLTLTCMAVWVLAGNYATAQISGDLPPNAVSGKCYAKCLIADQYEITKEQVQTKAAGTRTEEFLLLMKLLLSKLLLRQLLQEWK